MTNNEILKAALEQSALDNNCNPWDFLMEENVFVTHKLCEKSRKYLKEPISMNFISYGNNAVASVKEEFSDIAREYLDKFTFYECFETPNLHFLDNALEKYNQKVCFMAEYYLPDLNRLEEKQCKYETRLLCKDDFENLYKPEWSNALCEKRKELDIIGLGAYDKCKLIGLAGASADCDTMWQIGIDVLPEYRRQGVASALTSNLALKITEKGKIPFYCSAWSNIPSVRNAIQSGFLPSWVELTVKPKYFVDEFIR